MGECRALARDVVGRNGPGVASWSSREPSTVETEPPDKVPGYATTPRFDGEPARRAGDGPAKGPVVHDVTRQTEMWHMKKPSNGRDVVRYTSRRAWWTPALLPVLFVPSQVNSRRAGWLVADAVIVAVLLFIPYVVTHPTLTFSAGEITQRRGPFRVTIDLNALQSVRAITVNRRTNVMDPATGERRSVLRWYVKSPDDWSGRPPVQGFDLRDAHHRHLTLGVVRTSVDRWGVYLLSAISDHPDIEVGPHVVEALEALTR